LIRALLLRRAWLLANNLTTSVVILFLFPLSIFIFTNLALRKVPSIGLYDIEFDVWIYPSMILLVTGLCILPSIFRDVFDLRVHKKVLSYLSLSPHSKRYMILSFSIVSVVESIIFGLVSIILFSVFIPYPFGFIKTVGFIFYFSLYIFLLSNIFITISVLSDKLSTILISVFAFIFFLLFGSGLIISPSFYPPSLESSLSLLPLAMLIKAMQSYLFSGFINWFFTVIPFLTSLLLLSLNSFLIRNKLRQ
tara:strand:+ start:147 stop:896 length:750 start_codon:yes stop_codon:yes gene_type:complete